MSHWTTCLIGQCSFILLVVQKRWKWTKLNPIEILCQHFLGASIQNELVIPSLHFSLLPPALSVPELLTSKLVSVNAGSPLRCRQKKRHTQNMAFIAQIIDRSPHKSSTSTVATSVKLRGGCMWLIGGRGAALVIYACLSLAKTQRFLWRRAAPDGSLEANHAASNKNHMHGADTLLSGHPGGQAVVTPCARASCRRRLECGGSAPWLVLVTAPVWTDAARLRVVSALERKQNSGVDDLLVKKKSNTVAAGIGNY